MFDRLEIFLIGFAGLFEIVLLLLLLQPINRTHVAAWLKWLLAGAFLYHLGYFLRLLFQNERNSSAVWPDRLAMCGLCFGLLLMPSAMLHAALRLRNYRTSKSMLNASPSLWFGLLYLPLVLMGPASWLIVTGAQGDLMASVAPLTLIYLSWLAIANFASAIIFVAVGFGIDDRSAKHFFLLMSGILILLTAGAVGYACFGVGTPWEPISRILMGLAPLFPGVVFVWFVLKCRLLPVVFEQSIVYGGIVLVCLLMHRLIVTPMALALRSRFDVDLIIFEVLIVTGLIWWIRPLRRRVSESLRFLLSPSVFRVRDETRKLAIEIAQNALPSLDERCRWFAQELCRRFELQWVSVICLNMDDPDGPLLGHMTAKSPDALSHLKSTSMLEPFALWNRPVERGDAHAIPVSDFMEKVACDVLFPMRYKAIFGMVLFGSRNRFDRLADEQIMAISVLIDQFAATLQNQRDEQLRRRAELSSLQQEKLSTLGLISGSLAHELRNPLSSIRTIASLVAEDLPQSNSNHRDLNMIVTEVDRLNRTLQRMLDFARPPDAENRITHPDRVIERLVAIMDHYAKKCSTRVEMDLQCPNITIEASDASLNEVFMNLIKNAIEAASEKRNGMVRIQSQCHHEIYRVSVSDNGNGIQEVRLSKIFLPFETSKATGTGLGLYIVSERVREIGGSIHVESQQGQGSVFTVEVKPHK